MDKDERDLGVASAFLAICFYQGYGEFLSEIIKRLRGRVENPEHYDSYLALPEKYEWDSEYHTLFMILVNEYGSWGSSIRGGWIETNEVLLEDIETVLKEEYLMTIDEFILECL